MGNIAAAQTGASLYGSFIARCEEMLGISEPAEGVGCKQRASKCSLPLVTKGEDALAVASAFRSVYVDGNPACERYWSGNRMVADSFLASSILVLNEYMPESDRTFKGLLALVEMESVGSRVSPLDLLYEQISTGIKTVPKRSVALLGQSGEVDRATAERALGRASIEGLTCIWSPLRRRSDGAMPAHNKRADGLSGFTPDEDACLALYERYRTASPADRLIAVEEAKAAISFAIDPCRQRASEVSYSLLDALEASAHRAVLSGSASNELLLAESNDGLNRCMDALRSSGLG
ncbi:MAG: hypothetical protein Q4B77_06435 [Coriobacteriaceae bacterium]|nr:hypothetical protein [Coriobacteriaceae bacterium]